MKIAVLDDYQDVALLYGDWSGLDVTVFNEPLADPAAALQGFQVICIMRERTPFPRSLFEALPDLKLLVTTGARNLAIDLEAAKDAGVTVCGTASPGHATAELTWGLLLCLSRQLPVQVQSMQNGGWQVGLGQDLRGKTLGIIGLGRMGGQVATFAKVFGMNVIAWSRNLTQDKADPFGVQAVSKEQLLAESDFVTIHMKFGPTIKHLIGAAELEQMKPSAYLVNTSRAPIIDTDALIVALKAGQIAGAGIDVYDEEPLPADHPIRSCPNCVLTPHVGYVTRETYDVFYRETVEAVRAFMDGSPIRVMS